MIYLLIKSLHVCSIIVWIVGMVLLALALQRGGARSELGESSLQIVQFVRSWDRRGTVPAMLLTWLSGLYLATQGGWLGNRWLFAKLAIVIVLSGVHGGFAGRLRAHVEAQATSSPPALQRPLPLLFLMIASIVLLVIVKPR